MVLVTATPVRWQPQWSPPVTGGNTARETGVYVFPRFLPQWSPPVTGGNTPITAWLFAAATLPQWSPPVTGGNTAPRIRAV